MVRRVLTEGLREIRDDVIKIAGMASDAVSLGVRALKERNPELAAEGG
jgi:hypothetical protein